MRSKFNVLTIESIIESWPHGKKLTKFIAKDEGSKEAGDFTAIIHGLVTEDGDVVITHEEISVNE